MGKALAAGLKSKNTSITGLLLGLIAVLNGLLPGFDNDLTTSVDLNTMVVSGGLIIAAIQGLLARDADKSSQDSGVRK